MNSATIIDKPNKLWNNLYGGLMLLL